MPAVQENAVKRLHQEREIGTWNGFATLAIGIAIIAAAIWVLLHTVAFGRPSTVGGLVAGVLLFIGMMIVGALFLAGLYTVQPNEAAILQLFATVERAGSRGCAARTRSIRGARFRCARATSTASG